MGLARPGGRSGSRTRPGDEQYFVDGRNRGALNNGFMNLGKPKSRPGCPGRGIGHQDELIVTQIGDREMRPERLLEHGIKEPVIGLNYLCRRVQFSEIGIYAVEHVPYGEGIGSIHTVESALTLAMAR